jgi:hypothetical protein
VTLGRFRVERVRRPAVTIGEGPFRSTAMPEPVEVAVTWRTMGPEAVFFAVFAAALSGLLALQYAGRPGSFSAAFIAAPLVILGLGAAMWMNRSRLSVAGGELRMQTGLLAEVQRRWRLDQLAALTVRCVENAPNGGARLAYQLTAFDRAGQHEVVLTLESADEARFLERTLADALALDETRARRETPRL